MVNRVLEQKRLKIKRRHRYVALSGGDSKVAFGVVSFSKQVINVGLRVEGKAVPNYKLPEGKLEQRKKRSWDDVPKSLGLSMEREHADKLSSMFKNWDKDMTLFHRVLDGRKVKVFCIYDRLLTDIYLIEVDYRRQTVRRSCNYQTIQTAQDAAILGKALWLKFSVEVLSSTS